jgi:uroporphyrinogen decarboxylase
LTEPELYEALLDKIYAYQETVIKRSLELKPDIIHFGDDAGTTTALMINPVLWRNMIKPRLKKICDICKDAGCIVYMHCCGRIQDIIDDIIEIGVDILDPLQAGANDLSYIKSKARGRLTLYGGIDSHTVATADTHTVAELTRKVLRLLGDGGGYIAFTDNVLPFPAENIEAIRAVVSKEGNLSAAGIIS